MVPPFTRPFALVALEVSGIDEGDDAERRRAFRRCAALRLAEPVLFWNLSGSTAA